MNIAAWSDLHGYLPDYPGCDVALLAGDFSPLRAQRNPDQIHSWIRKEFLP